MPPIGVHSSDDESPVRTELCSPEYHNLYHYLMSTPNTEHFFTDVDSIAWDDGTSSSEENFPKAPLDDEVWSKDSIPDRQLCIHKTPHEPDHQCSYLYPCSTTTFRIDLPQSTPQDAAVVYYEQMDFSDISSDFPDIMMTTSDYDIPDLEDISDSEHLDNI